MRWNFDNAWINKIEGPGLNASNNEVAIENMELCHEGLSFESGAESPAPDNPMRYSRPAVYIERTDAAAPQPVVLRTDIAAFVGIAETRTAGHTGAGGILPPIRGPLR